VQRCLQQRVHGGSIRHVHLDDRLDRDAWWQRVEQGLPRHEDRDVQLDIEGRKGSQGGCGATTLAAVGGVRSVGERQQHTRSSLRPHLRSVGDCPTRGHDLA
jgi:hypothetical protein